MRIYSRWNSETVVLDFDGELLIGANLTGANLTDANLTGAVLTDANLRDAVLIGANLRGAVLCDANFEGTIMSYRERTVIVHFEDSEDTERKP